MDLHTLQRPTVARLFTLAGLLLCLLGTDRATATAAGATRTVRVIARLLQHPTAVAVDTRGNIYVLTTSNPQDGAQVIREAADGAHSTVLASGLKVETALAVDARGDVYLAATDKRQVLKIAPSGQQPVLASGFSNPVGVAVDATGVVYTVDNGVYPIKLIAISPTGARRVVTAHLDNLPLTLPAPLTVDQRGDLYVGDPGASWVFRIAPRSGAITTVHTGVCVCGAIAVDGDGDLYFADANYAPSTPPLASAPKAIPYDSNSDPYRNRVMERVANGALRPVGSALLGPAGVAVDAAGNVYIADTQHARVVEAPARGGPQVTIGPGLANPTSMAVDRAGNLYILDIAATGSAPSPTTIFAANHLVRLSPGGTATTLRSDLQAGLFYSVAVDSGGDVYVADEDHSRVLKLTAGATIATAVGGALRYPTNVAVDGAGTLYVTDSYGTHGKGNSATDDLEVRRIAASGGRPRVVFKQPGVPLLIAGLAGIPLITDPQGNLYITSFPDGTHAKVLRAPGGTGTPVALPIAAPLAEAIGASASGALYLVVQQGQHDTVLELPPGGGAPRIVINNASQGAYAVDSRGNIYAAGNGLVQEYVAPAAQG